MIIELVMLVIINYNLYESYYNKNIHLTNLPLESK